MADNNTDDDIYNDPDTIGAIDENVNGEPDVEPPTKPDDLSESIYTPEKDTTELDDRGPIDELEMADAKDTGIAGLDDAVDPALLDEHPSSSIDRDSYQQNDEEPKDEQDGTEE